MPSKNEFKVALDQVADYARGLDHEVLEENVSEMISFEDKNGEIHQFSGHRCSYDDTIYLIAGHPDFQFMSVLYFVSIKSYIESGITVEEANEIVEESDVEDEEITELAATKLLNQVDDETAEAVESYLYLMLSDSQYETDIRTTDDGNINYIGLGTDIFPYTDDFNIRRLYDGVSTIVNAGDKADNLIPRTIALTTPNEDTDRYELAFNLSW